MYHLDADSTTPLHRQLYEALKSEIIQQMKVGDKLPSIRKISTLYNLSKTTVERAFAQLYAEGYIYSRPKSGYFVSNFHFEVSGAKVAPSTPLPTPKSYRYDFFPAHLCKEDFPRKLWKRLQNKALDDSLDMGSYHDGQGESILREAIAVYLTTSRGVVCSSEQIIITHGFSDAMELLAKLVKGHYHYFGMESPGYHVARRTFEAFEYTICNIPVKADGIDLEALQDSQAEVVYITPSHQYPTGASMPVANRLALLHYMHKTGGLIIEDDYDSELTYTTRPIPSLQGLDQHDRVVYMGTFAKSLSPALRVSYMVLPRHLLPLFKESYDAYFPRVNIITQQTLAYFLSDGHYDKHLRKMRTLNRKKHNLMLQLFKTHLGNTYTILTQGGGLAILIMPSVPFDWVKFKTQCEAESIKLYFAKERSGGEFEALRMGFGGFSEEALVDAVEVFCSIWQECVL